MRYIAEESRSCQRLDKFVEIDIRSGTKTETLEWKSPSCILIANSSSQKLQSANISLINAPIINPFHLFRSSRFTFLQRSRKKKYLHNAPCISDQTGQRFTSIPEIERTCNLRDCGKILPRNTEFHISINRCKEREQILFAQIGRDFVSNAPGVSTHENVGCEARSLVTNAAKGRKGERRCLQEFSSNRQQTRQLHFIQRGLTLRRQKWNSIGAGTSVLSVLRGAGATYNVYDAVQAAEGRQRQRGRERERESQRLSLRKYPRGRPLKMPWLWLLVSKIVSRWSHLLEARLDAIMARRAA